MNWKIAFFKTSKCKINRKFSDVTKNGKISAATVGFVSEQETTYSHRREIPCDPRTSVS